MAAERCEYGFGGWCHRPAVALVDIWGWTGYVCRKHIDECPVGVLLLESLS